MLEAKVSIMRNSINFTMINNRDSMLLGYSKAQGFESEKDLGNMSRDY